jgi:hypothetical protein
MVGDKGGSKTTLALNSALRPTAGERLGEDDGEGRRSLTERCCT